MKILLIEDEMKLSHAMKRALEIKQFVVDLANDGEVGLDLAISEPYDLIILDLMLPKIDGLSICRKARLKGINTPILILTAKDLVSDKVLGLDSGADDYLAKPFSFEELFARIRALVRRASNNSSSILEIGDLKLDQIRNKVSITGKSIKLSQKEFSLLEFLLRHKNSVVSKEQIVRNVWNYDTNILPSTVEVHIKHLRDKLDQNKNKSIIKTIHGIGYEISDEE